MRERERERERESVCRERKVRMKKKGAIRVITSEINITNRKSVGKKESGGISIFQIPTYNPSIKNKK